MFLAYASGVVLAPGALIGLWLALRRPALARGARLRRARGHADRRPPARSGRIRARGQAPGAVLLLRGAARRDRLRALRLPRLAAPPRPRRPRSRARPARRARPAVGLFRRRLQDRLALLFATSRLEQALGNVSLASLAIALAVTVLAAAVVLLARRPAIGTPATLGLALAVCAAAYGAAVSFNLGSADRARESVLGPQPSFVDASGVDGRGHAPDALEQPRDRLRVPLLEPLRRRRLPPPLRRASRCIRGHAADNRRGRDAARGREACDAAAARGQQQRHHSLPGLRGGRHVTGLLAPPLARPAAARPLRAGPLRGRVARPPWLDQPLARDKL